MERFAHIYDSDMSEIAWSVASDDASSVSPMTREGIRAP